MKKIKDFYEAYWFCKNHVMFNHCVVYNNMDIEVVKVSPKSNKICDDESKNTKTQVWLEWGPISCGEGILSGRHDTDLDCGGDTFEEAIIKLSNLIKKKYPFYEKDSKECEMIQNALFNIREALDKKEDVKYFSLGDRGWKTVIKKYYKKN